MKKYRAVIFDLFSTVAIWQPDRLPLFEWRGKTSHSTMGGLRATIEEIVTEVSFSDFVDSLDDANEQMAARRAENMLEITSHERFLLALSIAGYTQSEATRDLAQALSLQHMDLLAAAVEIPSTHVEFLSELKDHYKIGLLSNFDHGVTARRILERDGAARHFDPIVISDEHGWRKPHPKIFLDTLATLGVGPEDALYVGDSVSDDIAGAKGAGIDIAWVNAHDTPLPEESETPNYVVKSIPDLASILLKS
ncbi:MAG: HAD superfamily hydrolase (TIGR01549 family) [Gammaproteobacteria bacterium]